MSNYTPEQLAERRKLADAIDRTCGVMARACDALERFFEQQGIDVPSSPSKAKRRK